MGPILTTSGILVVNFLFDNFWNVKLSPQAPQDDLILFRVSLQTDKIKHFVFGKERKN